ncbi:MAG: peptide ABC transporter substrate-binding protein [Candidatus Omnitrophica bacterium CG11_big_fil_rev_8_21_14_0_20_42_13]|uniref:Peptide ABC transporter substrate-binding protein n=1 Tax=Candidatus Ghiorseimicrobium undicola TaxID=1974746 RepID=A0A2H0LVI7_9BACT|nr:MAG: peptide ABC transporter substrate-binding protein [Candidatus Omnitrophica bacterium CG11_big_fil_rev_8_21_14_0_20_42_13]
MSENLLQLKEVKKYFPIKKGLFYKTVANVKAVDGVDLSIGQRQTLGLVGESGCGKTTLSRIILRLIKEDSGSIYFNGRNLCAANKKELRQIRKGLQVVFQDPFNSLDPKFRVREILKEALYALEKYETSEFEDRAVGLLDQVGLGRDAIDRFPYEFSGGERQRIAIARAISTNPKMLILDEAVSSLDVLIQKQILDLLLKLKDELQISCLFISHNLNVLKNFSDRIAVMYLGKMAEVAPALRIFSEDNLKNVHPYTEALILSGVRRKVSLKGEPESLLNIPSGCRFHTRCPYRKDVCRKREPALELKKNGHFIACHFR